MNNSKKCPSCHGTGSVTGGAGSRSFYRVMCRTCEGTGRVPSADYSAEEQVEILKRAIDNELAFLRTEGLWGRVHVLERALQEAAA